MRSILRGLATLDVLVALLLFGLAFAAYNSTLTPSLSYASPDGGEIATVPYRLGLLHPTGYPFYTWVAKLFTYLPVGDVAHRINLLSAAGAAASAAVVYGIVLVLTGARLPSLFAAALWALSATLWSQAVIAEVYAPNAFMLALTLLLAMAWGRQARTRAADGRPGAALFLGLCLAFGLSLGTHLSNLAFAPALALYVLVTDWRLLSRPWLVVPGGLLFAAGVLQFVWLPIKAADLNDPLILSSTPDSAGELYDFTLNAFERLRWAFPLDALPSRVELYLRFVRDNFGLAGGALAVFGALELARLRTREFLLLAAGYGIELAFFLEYRVFDIDVFFIPAHLVTAVCAGYGAWRLLRLVAWATARSGNQRIATAGLLVASAALFLPLLPAYADSRDANDSSRDTVIGDFYNAVFARLPPNSSLVGLTGVIGSDMFYYRLVEDLRPDVSMPLLRDPTSTRVSDGSRLFSTWKSQPGARRIPWAPPPQMFAPDAWFVPVLAAPSTPTGGLPFQRPLTLYEVSKSPPPGMVVPDPRPQVLLNVMLLDVRLVGYDRPQSTVAAGGLVRIRLYWSFTRSGTYSVTTRLGESEYTETHWMTFGDLPRYLREFGTPRPGWASLEDYDLVVPSSQPTGTQKLTVTVTRYGVGGERAVASTEAGTITVVR